MVGAGESLASVATRVTTHHRASMSATVVEHMNLTVGMPHHDHGLPANQDRAVIAGPLHLALVSDIDPGAMKNCLHFLIEDGGLDVDAPMHAMGLDQAGEITEAIPHVISPLSGPPSQSARPGPKYVHSHISDGMLSLARGARQAFRGNSWGIGGSPS